MNDWITEQVQVVPLDDGQIRSYMIFRQNSSTDQSNSFILDLNLNKNFYSPIPIEYNQQEFYSNRSGCLFYTGSVRHWGELNSLVAVSVCNGLVRRNFFLFHLIIKYSCLINNRLSRLD